LNAGAKVPQDRKQLLICKLLNSSVVCHDPTYNQTVMSGRIQYSFVDLVAFFIRDRACSLRFDAVVSGAKLVRLGRDRSLDIGCMVRLALFSFLSDLSHS